MIMLLDRSIVYFIINFGNKKPLTDKLGKKIRIFKKGQENISIDLI